MRKSKAVALAVAGLLIVSVSSARGEAHLNLNVSSGDTGPTDVNGIIILDKGRTVDGAFPKFSEIAVNQMNGSRLIFRNFGDPSNPYWVEVAHQAGPGRPIHYYPGY
jgi:hypothetical protein